jgi:hypothetical protein
MTRKQQQPCGTLAPVFTQHVDLVRRWAEEVTELVSDFDNVFDTSVDEVENRSRDGFIPFTDGGFNGIACASLRYSWSSGNAPKMLQPMIDSILDDYKKKWDEDNPKHPYSWIFAHSDDAKTEMFGSSKEREHWKEKYWEDENECFGEDDTYFYKIRVLFHGDRHNSVSGEPEALFFVGVNTDIGYGRDNIPWLSCYGGDPQQSKWLWEKTVKISDLTEEMIDGFIQEAADALRSA